FAKLVDFLTFGAVSEKQETETFTAVTIVQQLNVGLRSIDVKNVIRLAVDDYDFYLDEKGQEDDLEQAMFEFKTKVDPIESEYYNTIFLVLEHVGDSFKYLIEIAVLRKHKIGEYPITVNVNGVLTDFKLNENETTEQLQKRIADICKTQETYGTYLDDKRLIFNQFLDDLEMAIRKFIKVDDIRKFSDIEIIRPKSRITGKEQIRHERFADPIYYGYFGFDDYFFYSWIWSDVLYSTNIYLSDFDLVDEIGNPVMTVGDTGFYSGNVNTFNLDAPFEAPDTGRIEYYGNNEYQDDLISANLIQPVQQQADDSDTTDWLNTDQGSYDEASCNSCSSCGSCSSD
ncbi:MAG: hypothetical protein ABSG15_07625, partial [FCB group bacterium]